MTRRPLLLFAFPALILLILAAERTATVLLGVYPASPDMWRIWLALHPFPGAFWQQVDLYLNGSMALDAALLGVALVVCWMACLSRRPAAFFLTNHMALLLAGVLILIGAHSETASTIAAFPAPSGFPFSLKADLNWPNGLLSVLGVSACAYCHFAYLAELRQRNEARRVRILALQRDL